MNTEANDMKFKNISKEVFSLPTSTIKGLLFECHVLINDIQACDRVNEKTKRCKNKINNHRGIHHTRGNNGNDRAIQRHKDENEVNNFT